MTADPIETLAGSISDDRPRPLYLITGDRVLSEAGAMRIAAAIAARAGCETEVHVRPASLGDIIADLKTYSLFSPAKVVVAIETSLLADESAAAQLVDEVLEVLPLGAAEAEVLSAKERRAASQLLHTLRLFRIDPHAGSAESAVGMLPDVALKGGKTSGRKRARGRRQIEEARQQLTGLLAVARLTDLRGRAETDSGELLEIVERGLPEGHSLVLAESAVAPSHPLVTALKETGCLVELGGVQATKKRGWQGLDRVADELERETGVAITPRGLTELANRTLQMERSTGREMAGVSGASSARFAAEYRKLATLARGGRIDIELVESSVEDRGEEDVWQTLDAIGTGRSKEALERIDRLLASSEDTLAERLSFFALLSSFCRQLTALSRLIDDPGIGRRQTNYQTFKTQIAPRLQAELPSGARNPLGDLHPFRLYRAYGVACRMPSDLITELPARVLETELRLKGDSDRPDVALTTLVGDLTTAVSARG